VRLKSITEESLVIINFEHALYLYDRLTTKSARDEDCRARLDWRDEQSVTSEEA